MVLKRNDRGIDTDARKGKLIVRLSERIKGKDCDTRKGKSIVRLSERIKQSYKIRETYTSVGIYKKEIHIQGGEMINQ